jgi:hypothetical protein
MINLIIKGNSLDAANAAYRNGVRGLRIIRELVTGQHVETVAECPATERNAVSLVWFCADGFDAPFPAGALLWYGDRA